MKQILFKIIPLLLGLVMGFGCEDADHWDPEGIEAYGRLIKIVENGRDVEIPDEIITEPDYCVLSLMKDHTFQGSITINDMEGIYQQNASSGKINIQIQRISEVLDARYHEFESRYVSLLRKVSSYQHTGSTLKLYFGEDSYLQYSLTKEERK